MFQLAIYVLVVLPFTLILAFSSFSKYTKLFQLNVCNSVSFGIHYGTPDKVEAQPYFFDIILCKHKPPK